GGRSRFFKGPWHAWRKEQAARELALGRAVERQQAEIERLERFVERFSAGTRARQAQARVKKLDKIERIERGPTDGQALSFSFSAPERSGRVVFELEDGRIDVGDPPFTLLDAVELWLERGEHVSLVGPNGSGKTTLIEALAGRRELGAGKLRRGHNVQVGYLSQHTDHLDESGSVLGAVQSATGLTPNKARALLGRFLFSGEQAEKPVSGLSGGERRRLALAVLVNSGANVLILDEPTNHLDLESREALEDALGAFTGSLLLVSHDRALLDAVGSRTVAVEDGSLRTYVGGWAEYVRVRDERRAAGTPWSPPPSPSPSRRRMTAAEGTPAVVVNGTKPKAARAPAKVAKGGPADASKNRLREQAKAERAVEDAEAAMRALEEELSDPAAWATKYESGKSEARHTAARRAVDSAYAKLEALID
ncbi:MAG TPA: ATP-binding cassette domain-containing protein, partial [Solirubrobacteraceae bacterium]|nr:ATP-binding cassette domain-containing protein [Solirubrobacteraceae bacterium]